MEEIKNNELEQTNTTTTTEKVADNEVSVENTEGTTENATQNEEKEEIKPLPEQKPFILNRYEQAILDEMERRAAENPALAEGLKNKDKTIQECYAFVANRAEKMADDNCVMIEDNVVYAWATFYYTQRREIIELELKPKPKPSAPIVPPKPATKTETKKDTAKKKETKPAPKAEAPKVEKPKAETPRVEIKVQTPAGKDKVTTEKGRDGKVYTITELGLF